MAQSGLALFGDVDVGFLCFVVGVAGPYGAIHLRTSSPPNLMSHNATSKFTIFVSYENYLPYHLPAAVGYLRKCAGKDRFIDGAFRHHVR